MHDYEYRWLASTGINGNGNGRIDAYRCVGPGVVGGHLVGPGVLAVSRRRPVGDVAWFDRGFLLIPGFAEDNREPVGRGRVVDVPFTELGYSAASVVLHNLRKIKK